MLGIGIELPVLSTWYMLALYSLAVWRLSTMLVGEAGPGNVLGKIRMWSGVSEFGYSASNEWTPLTCIFCTSIYVSAVLLFAPTWVLWILGLSGGAVWLERLSQLCLVWTNSQRS